MSFSRCPGYNAKLAEAWPKSSEVPVAFWQYADAEDNQGRDQGLHHACPCPVLAALPAQDACLLGVRHRSRLGDMVFSLLDRGVRSSP